MSTDDYDNLCERKEEIESDIRACETDIQQFKDCIAKNEDRRRDLDAEDEWLQDKAWRSVVHDSFYPDLAAKRLIYTSPDRNEDAGGSILRVLKFYQRGYRIPLDSLGAVVTRLLRGVNWKELTGHQFANYNDEHMAKILTGLLREVDPSIDPDHVAHLPSISEEDNGTVPSDGQSENTKTNE